MDKTLVAHDDDSWTLIADGYDSLRERSIESRFAISNGLLGVRGVRATTRGERWVAPARTYVAGLFDAVGNSDAIPGLVPAADWLRLRLLLPGGMLVRHPGEMSAHRMTLDMRRGVLLSESRQSPTDDPGAHLRTLRLVSLSDRQVGLQVIEFTIQQEELDITLEASFEGTHLGLMAVRLGQEIGVWHTSRSGKALAIAEASSLRIDGCNLAPVLRGELSATWRWHARAGQVVSFDRMVSVVRSDSLAHDPASEASEILDRIRPGGRRSVVAAHEVEWTNRWDCSDVQIEGDAGAQKALRFAVYHLNSAANPADERVSIGARALTGDDYHGHVFWDTEIYLLPFYSLTWPQAARALLMYRYHTLDGARAKATGMGWRGALYAWESTDTGAEMTPEHVVGPDREVVAVLCGKQEQHISADVAYAVWQYWQATGDEGFLLDAGAEILFETARFWSSRAVLESDGYRHIRGVIGPDEYHEHVDDNAFTNVMARWNICRAIEVAGLLQNTWPERWSALTRRLSLNDIELATWAEIVGTIATGLNIKTGIFEQFEGYSGLEAIPLADYAGRTVPMDVVLGRTRIQASQVIKQADVVALIYLLPEKFPGSAAADNFKYYETRCSHGSSLSRAMHGLVAARLGDSRMAIEYFRSTAEIDLGDSRVEIDGGVHIAALGGMWMIAVLGFAGVSLRPDGIGIDPHMPSGWRSLVFRIHWHNRKLRISIGTATEPVDVTLEVGGPMTVFVRGEPRLLSCAEMPVP